MKFINYAKYAGEFSGTLVLFSLINGGLHVLSDNYGTAAPFLASGLTMMLVGMAYIIDRVSGCHLNPAVSIAMFIAGRMNLRETIIYILAQSTGIFTGAYILLPLLLSPYSAGPIENKKNAFAELSSLEHYSLGVCFLAETIFIILFLWVLFSGVSRKRPHHGFAGVFIGLTFALMQIACTPLNGSYATPALNMVNEIWLLISVPLPGCMVSAFVWRFYLNKRWLRHKASF